MATITLSMSQPNVAQLKTEIGEGVAACQELVDYELPLAEFIAETIGIADVEVPIPFEIGGAQWAPIMVPVPAAIWICKYAYEGRPFEEALDLLGDRITAHEIFPFQELYDQAVELFKSDRHPATVA